MPGTRRPRRDGARTHPSKQPRGVDHLGRRTRDLGIPHGHNNGPDMILCRATKVLKFLDVSKGALVCLGAFTAELLMMRRWCLNRQHGTTSL